MRLLLVEDDAILADGIQKALHHSSYSVEHTDSGEEADYLLSIQAYDSVILDLGLPYMDGLEVLKRLRGHNNTVPVLILTARDTMEDTVAGLDAGADDYLTKPFRLPELEARLRAILRRRHQIRKLEFNFGALRFDPISRQAFVNDITIELSARETDILEIMLINSGQVVSKHRFIQHLCNWDEPITLNAVEVYISRLRRKLEPYHFKFRSIRGIGYLLEKHDDL